MTKQESLERMASDVLADNERIAALDQALRGVVTAWDSLKTGVYPRDVIETWLLHKMKPAIDTARKIVTPS